MDTTPRDLMAALQASIPPSRRKPPETVGGPRKATEQAPKRPRIPAYHAWPTNAHLISDVHRLGFLDDDWLTLDATYNQGNFWAQFRPLRLVTLELDERYSVDVRADFTRLPFADDTFDAVVYDPPYKLNGTPDESVDTRYGVHVPTRWQDRMTLCQTGGVECARVVRPGGYLLFKCQNQVCSGQVRWQTRDLPEPLLAGGWRLVTEFHRLGGRAQDDTRRQVHPNNNASTLLVLRKSKTTRKRT